MSVLTSQKNLDLTIKSTLGDDKLIVDEVTIDEALHDFFDIKIVAHSEDINIDFESVLGKNMTVSLNIQTKKRHFSGVVTRFEQIHTTVLEKQKKLVAFYHIQLKPKFWVLTHSKDYRIFQKKSVQEIIKEILSDASVTDFDYKTKKGTSKKREYCVQYDESNFEFIARLCEEEGIFFHFEHEESIHKLIFSDKDILPTKIEGDGFPYVQKSPSSVMLNHIYECIPCEQIVPKEFQTTDYDYLKPTVALSGKATEKAQGGKYYDYPGLFEEASDGEKIAKSRLEALTWSKKFLQGSGSAPEFIPYKKFKLTNHPRKSLNAEYVIYRVKHKISQAPLENISGDPGYDKIYENQFWAYPTASLFTPVQKHFKKRIYSLQTATVTGPSGEEIHTDKYGRVKVKFHWDTRGTKDDKSSCWIRVAQNWAGKKWGALVIPRIDMEVIVSFIDGDPDRPLVMGCVYNGESLPPYASENPTRSTFKSSSSKGDKGNNELRFEDKQDKEEIYIHAQKDLNLEIENSRTEKIIKGDDELTIEKGKKSEKLEGSGTKYSTEITDGDKTLKITKGNQKIELVNGDQTIEITKGSQKISLTNGDMKIELVKGKSETTLTNGDMKITLAKGKMDIIVQDAIKVVSQKDIQFVSSGGQIMMQAAKGIVMNTPKEFMIQGKDVMIQGGTMTTVASGKDLILNGGMNIVQNAGANLVAKGGANVAVDGGAGVVIKGATITTTAQGAQTMQASGVMTIKGSMLNLN